MPNWCENILKVTGDLSKFKETLNKPNSDGEIVPFSFHQTVPMPDNVERGLLPLDAPYPNWYDWSNKNWGTKWDANDPTIRFIDPLSKYKQISDEIIEIEFSTAWSPPIKWLLQVSKAFPMLRFNLKYFEIGMQFYGTTECYLGQIVTDFQGKVECEYDEKQDCYIFMGPTLEFYNANRFRGHGG